MRKPKAFCIDRGRPCCFCYWFLPHWFQSPGTVNPLGDTQNQSVIVIIQRILQMLGNCSGCLDFVPESPLFRTERGSI